ncbi:MAG: hypothetical protein AAB783_02490 [Patescibacteria group bacterium]
MKSLKRKFYLFCTSILGVLLATIIHALIEGWYITLLISDFDIYSLGLSWPEWFVVHNIVAGTFWFFGVLGGYWLGVRWWQIVYIEHRHWLRRKHK